MDLILIDSAALIALADAPDRHHREARATYSRLMAGGCRLVTTNHVADETCTWLLRHARNGHQAAARFGRTIRNGLAVVAADEPLAMPPGPSRLVVVYSDPALERRAWDIFEKYDSAGFSFTDCVSFAVMEALSIRKAFTFDEHYDILGFERLPG
jgi:uncharacterized protein